MAYTRKQVIFQKYNSLEGLDSVLYEKRVPDVQENEPRSKDILELHLFDKEKEYRIIASESKRKDIMVPGLSAIEHIADFSDKETAGNKTADSKLTWGVYKERIQLEPAFMKSENGIKDGYITVLNHVSYQEDGMARVDDYRLVMEG